MTNSINTNLAAYSAQAYLSISSSSANKAVSRLSSGNRIVQASDDVAALSIGTSLQSNVSTLKVALVNTNQATSLLQVADGALAQLGDILQRQKALAVQATAGSLDNVQRSFLDQEFQALASEIDRLVGQTNFNGVALLNGQLSERVKADSVTNLATKAGATLTFSDNAGNGETFKLAGITFTGVTGTPSTSALEVKVSSTTAQTVQNIANMLNNAETDSRFTSAQKLAISQAVYVANGASLQVYARSGGSLGNNFRIDMTGTATDTAAEANIGGGFGGGYIDMFQTGFSSSTQTVAATFGNVTSAIPFETGMSITASINSVTYTLATVAVGDTLSSIVNSINANASTNGVKAELTYTSSKTYNIRLKFDQSLGNATISGGTNYNVATYNITAAASTQLTTTYGLKGGVDDGLGIQSTAVSGSVGNNVLTGLVQNKAKVVVSFPEIATADLTSTSNFGNSSGVYVTVGGHNFMFTSTSSTSKAADEITIGSTLEETLDNAVATINSFMAIGSNAVGAEQFQMNQIKLSRNGRDLVFEGRGLDNVTTITGSGASVNFVGISTVSKTNSGNLDNADTGGVIVQAVNNKDFIGKISGFTVTPTNADTANIQIKVGDYTYKAQSVDTTPTANTTVRLYSDTLADGSSGGYFDIELSANNGVSIGSSTDSTSASTLAARLDAAFSSLTFYQNRIIENYSGTQAIVADGAVTGSLVGSKASIQLGDFEDVKIDSINVTAPSGSNANGSIAFVVDGEAFVTAANIGSKLGANQTYRLTSTLDANKFIEFTTGKEAIDFGNSSKAEALENALKSAFGVGDGSSQLSFQVGTTTSDVLKVGIDRVDTDALYQGVSLNVKTQDDAFAASDALDAAIKVVTAVRAQVGALQSRFNFASNNIQSSIQNQDAARSTLLDTDIGAESTSYATAQVKLQAGISVLAQANQQLQALLKLIA